MNQFFKKVLGFDPNDQRKTKLNAAQFKRLFCSAETDRAFRKFMKSIRRSNLSNETSVTAEKSE